MKVSIQLRKSGKANRPAKLYFRVREGDVDIKTASSLTIFPEYWDGVNYRYKDNVPTDKVPKMVQNLFNCKIKSIIENIYDKFHDGADAVLLASIIKDVDDTLYAKERNTGDDEIGFGNKFGNIGKSTVNNGNRFGNKSENPGNNSGNKFGNGPQASGNSLDNSGNRFGNKSENHENGSGTKMSDSRLKAHDFGANVQDLRNITHDSEKMLGNDWNSSENGGNRLGNKKRILGNKFGPSLPASENGTNVHKSNVDMSEKTLLEYFGEYLETSNLNAWHHQSLTTVMKRVSRYERWLAFKMRDEDFKLYLSYFDKEGTQDYLEFVENEYKIREDYPNFYKDIQLYADYNIRPMSKNSISCHAKRLFMFLNWCVRNGYLDNQTYNNVTIDQQVYGTPYYLTIEERDKIYYMDFSGDARLDYHRDKFIFQCLTGCRQSDLTALTWNHIVDGNFIEYIPHKNLLHGRTDMVRCPLCAKAKEILERLDPTMPYLFIRYCEDNYRKDIKRILKLAGIDRMVTIHDPLTRKAVQKPIYEVASSHLARRTFIGNLYKQVHDPALISSLTGHAENSKSFERYRSIDDDIKRDVLKYIQ